MRKFLIAQLTSQAAECTFQSIVPSCQDKKSTSAATFASSKGDINITHPQCYGKRATACVGAGMLSGRKEEEGLYVVLVPDTHRPETTQVTSLDALMAPSEYEKYATNIALLAAAGFGGGVQFYSSIAITNIAHNKTFQRKVSEKYISEVDLHVFVPAVCLLLQR